MIGSLEPTAEERAWGAGRVEGHRCSVCAAVTRFPRYGNPVKLLETRQGMIPALYLCVGRGRVGGGAGAGSGRTRSRWWH